MCDGLRRIRGLLLVTLLGVAIPAAAHAQAQPERTPEAVPGWGYGLANELMSPYCPGRALPDCPSPQAAELRQWIVAQEHEGRSKDDVMRQLLARFGEELLQKPRVRGFGLMAYAMPIAGVLAGGGLLFVFFRRQLARAAEEPAAARGVPLDPELERLVDEELRRAKGGA